MTTAHIQQPNYCGKCGQPWYQVHTCPTVGGTTGGSLNPGVWSHREPELILVPKLEWEAMKARLLHLEAALIDGSPDA